MGPTTELRRALKRDFYPFMQARGFTLDQRHAPWFVDFRRSAGDRVELLELQWEKYGTPRFVVNFGTYGARGVVCLEQVVEPGDVGPGQMPAYCRLHPNGSGWSTRHWFCQDRPLVHRLLGRGRLYPPEAPVAQLVALFPEIEAFWGSGVVGPHSRKIENRFARDVQP